MGENWHEMQHDFNDLDKTISSLQFISSSEQIQVFSSEDLTGKWLSNPIWAIDDASKRLFIAGNEHGDILRFLEVYRLIFHPILPLTVVNFDHHIDDAKYQQKEDAFSSWQRYLYEEGITKVLQSYNVTAVEGHKKSSTVTQLMLASEFSKYANRLSINLLSIDLDVFNDNLPGDTQAGDDVFRDIDLSIKNSQCVMPFLSPVFTTHGFEEQILKDIFTRTIKKPVDPMQFISL